MKNPELGINDVLLLDHVQKKRPVNSDEIKKLRQKSLIEGRKPNFYISSSVASLTEKKAEYIRFRGQDDEFYIKQIKDYIQKFGSASRSEIDTLLLDKLSDGLNPIQKRNKVRNLLTKLARDNKIYNSGSRKSPTWKLVIN
jgi:ATP-dependent DNA helicase RecG